MRKVRGFTLLELVIVMVVLGILMAVAIPKYLNIREEATEAAKVSTANTVRSAFAMAMLELKAYPKVTELVKYCHDMVGQTGVLPKAHAVATGIEVTIDQRNYVIPTYTDTACSTPTAKEADEVKCVGFAPLGDKAARESVGIRQQAQLKQ